MDIASPKINAPVRIGSHVLCFAFFPVGYIRISFLIGPRARIAQTDARSAFVGNVDAECKGRSSHGQQQDCHDWESSSCRVRAVSRSKTHVTAPIRGQRRPRPAKNAILRDVPIAIGFSVFGPAGALENVAQASLRCLHDAAPLAREPRRK
jgi:hypothetical protein